MSDLNLGLTSFALINLDEFDCVTQRQQIVLKYLVSTAVLKYRPPYGKAYSSHRCYASFIGTTNETMPLTDPTGSHRFICVEVDGNIDFESSVNYGQLYAQLKYEVEEISALLKNTFKGAYQPNEGSLVKIGQFLSRPEYKFESERSIRGILF